MKLNEIRIIQLQQLEALKYLIKVLDKEKIPYFAIGGTALGAIRHKGFIPWDDDIDIGILRPDYDRFLKLQEKLPKNLLITNFKNNKNTPFFFTKVYDLDMQYYTRRDRMYDLPNSIFVDVFPWDNIEKPDELYKKISKLSKIHRRLVYRKKGNLIDKAKILLYKIKYGFKTSEDNYNEMEATLKDFYSEKSNTWANILFNDILEYDDIFPLRQELFEGMLIKVPNKCEKYLELKYGDYMTLPDEKDRVNHAL